jgi:hypothetical protein
MTLPCRVVTRRVGRYIVPRLVFRLAKGLESIREMV